MPDGTLADWNADLVAVVVSALARLDLQAGSSGALPADLARLID